MAFCRLHLATIVIFILVILPDFNEAQSNQGCIKHTFATGQFDIACRCNLTYCDKIEFDWPSDKILVVETSRAGKRFSSRTIRMTNYASRMNDNGYANEDTANKLTVQLYPDKKMQKILGFGGSITDSAAIQLQSMPEQMRQAVLEQYYDNHGLRYTLSRVPISGTDFSVRNYSYDDVTQKDFSLAYFKLQEEDFRYKIPNILKAMEIVRRASYGRQTLRLVGSSWSPPAWMKDNNSLVRGHLIGNSSGPYYDALARYLVRFLKEYEAYGINFWGLTTQNEPWSPHLDIYTWNSLIFEPDQLNAFVRDSLGPTLAKNGFGKDKLKLIIFDDNVYEMISYVEKFAYDNKTMSYVDGVGLHWYARNLRPYSVLDQVRNMLPPSKYILSTESSNEGGTKPGNWQNGANYAGDIIQTLRHNVVGWIDWNLVLDMIGGPNWVKNYVDSPILFDREASVYYKNPMYYVLGHFSRFFEPQAQVFESEIISMVPNDTEVFVIAGERPNKSHYSVVIFNNGTRERMVTIRINQKTILENLPIDANSVTSVAIPNRNNQMCFSADSICLMQWWNRMLNSELVFSLKSYTAIE